jgi:arginine/ornithine transport system permease protein
MDSFLHGFLPSLLEGAGLTLLVAVLSLCVAVVLGLAGCFAKLSKLRVARRG